MTLPRVNEPAIDPGAAWFSGPREVRWIDARTHERVSIATLLGPKPDVVLGDAGSARKAVLLAAGLGAPLLLDARGASVPSRTSAAFARAHRVLADDDAQRSALERAGVEAGRVWVIDPASPGLGDPADAGRSAITRLASLPEALRETRRLARGRGIANRPAGFYARVKRGMDFMTGITLLVLLAPLLLLVAVLIRIDSPGPALFRQRRIGRATSEFTILKFRTMFAGTPDLASHLVGPGSSRVTRLGRFLRRTSIDELPQLWHLITGDMSLVGPRPALHNQYDLIGLRQAAGVDALKPGVTGWAQVNGRDDIPLARKVEFDRHYLEHVGFSHDLMILARTVVVLFSDRGTY